VWLRFHRLLDAGLLDGWRSGASNMIEDFWSTDPDYQEWLDSLEEQDDATE
jgi:hypothetical protein